MIGLCVNLVNIGPVTLEFKIGKDVHPVVSFSKIRFPTNYLSIHRTNFHQIFTMW